MRKSISITALILLIIQSTSFGQWVQSDQPAGGYCHAIERVGNQIWSAYEYGIYVSDNEGVTWQQHPIFHNSISDIEAFGDTVVLIYTDIDGTSLYNLRSVTSFDGGLTWNFPVIIHSNTQYIHQSARTTFVLDTALMTYNDTGDYYVSYDYGMSWSSVVKPGNYGIIAYNEKYLLTWNPTVSPIGNYYSDDAGQTWTAFDSTYIYYRGLIVDTTFFFIDIQIDSIWHNSILRTTDFGLTYDTVHTNNAPAHGKLAYFYNRIVLSYYVSGQGFLLYESFDNGDTWGLSNTPKQIAWAHDDNAIELSNHDWLLGFLNMGILRWKPAEGSVFSSETGISAERITSLFENNDALFAKAGGRYYRSVNASATWNALPSFIDANYNLTCKGDSIFGMTRIRNGTSNLACSYDNGLTWDSIYTSFQGTWTAPRTIMHYNGRLFAAEHSSISVSYDWGVNWLPVSPNVDVNCSSPSTGVQQFIVCNNRLFAIDGSARQVNMYDTIAGTWIKKYCIPPSGVTYDKLFSLEGVLAIVASGSFRISVDTGNTWTAPLRNGFPSNINPTALYAKDGIWYAPGHGNIYYSTNLGNNWQQLGTDPLMVITQYKEPIFTFLNGLMYAGGNNIWKGSDTLNIISGQVYLDWSNNGIRDSGEDTIPYHLLYSSPNNSVFNTDSTGTYQFITAAKGDELRPTLLSKYSVSNPTSHTINGNASNVDFGLYFLPDVLDLSVDLSHHSPFRPGFNTMLVADIRNLATIYEPNALLVIYLDSNVNYVSASVPPNSITNDSIVFAVDTLKTFESQRFLIEINVPITIPIMSALFFKAQVLPILNDSVPANNTSVIAQETVGSFDPNDKQASYDPYFSPKQLMDGDEMIYTIRFQNTGTFAAEDIKIIDTLSHFIDLSSFRVVSSSHDMFYEFTGGNVVTFYFENIFLPDSASDQLNSHGYAKFAVRYFKGLPIGTGITNTAYIYFDFNTPIKTNIVSTLIADPPIYIGISEHVDVANIMVFPNPVKDQLHGTVDLGGSVKSFTIRVVDLLGRVVYQSKYLENEFSIDVSSYESGVYTGLVVSEYAETFVTFRFMVIK